MLKANYPMEKMNPVLPTSHSHAILSPDLRTFSVFRALVVSVAVV